MYQAMVQLGIHNNLIRLTRMTLVDSTNEIVWNDLKWYLKTTDLGPRK